MSSALVSNVKFESEEQILAIKKHFERVCGCEVYPRGRHSDRKLVYLNIGKRWVADTQNDIPWRLAETVSFYKHTRRRN